MSSAAELHCAWGAQVRGGTHRCLSLEQESWLLSPALEPPPV